MLLRIALAIAILGGIAVTVLNFVQVKDKVTTIMADRDKNAQDRDKNAADRDAARKLAAQTKATLDQTKKELDSTKTERDTAVAEAEQQRKESGRLKGQLEKATGEKVDAQRELAAWKALGYSVDQIKGLVVDYKQARTELTEVTNLVLNLQKDLSTTTTELRKFRDPNYEVPEPNITAKVIVVDPKFDFVILDAGQNKGMVQDGDMLISRDGKLVAKVRVRSVERDRCVANVLPGWKLSEVMEGDLAVPKLPKI